MFIDERKFLSSNNLFLTILVLGLIGIARNTEEVILGITLNPKWYSLEPDVLFTMFSFPIYLCFFTAFIFYSLSRIMTPSLSYKRIFNCCFNLQLLHLVIPIFDFIGLKLNIHYSFYIFKSIALDNFYFFPALIMTLGIIIAWLVALLLVSLAFFRKLTNWRFWLVLSIVFSTLYWPIYHLFPLFDHLTNKIICRILPIGPLSCQSLVIGYGMFFAVSASIGVFYFVLQKRKTGYSL